MNGLTADVGSPRTDEEPDQVGKILRHAFASKGNIEVAIEGWNHRAAALTLRIEGPYDNGPHPEGCSAGSKRNPAPLFEIKRQPDGVLASIRAVRTTFATLGIIS